MSAVVVVAAVIGIFFLVGLLVGVVVMAALAARRTSGTPRRPWSGFPAQDPGPDDDRLDEPPSWPTRGDR